MIPAAQAEVAALLRRLAGADPVETHISAVFVGPDTVWKLKKAVALGFLDFSTLAAREHFLRRELALNRPVAPALYRDVVPVTRAPEGGLALDGPGEVVDWVLRMAPVPAGDFLDAVAARGGLDDRLLDAIADAAFALHAALPPLPGVDAPAALHRVLEGNAAAALAAGLPAPRVEALAAADARLDRPARAHPGGARRGRPGAALPWRPAPGEPLPAAGARHAFRRAGIRRGAGDHRYRLRPRLPADGPRPPGRPAGGEPGAEPLCGAQRRCRAGRRPAALALAAGDDPGACRGQGAGARRRACPISTWPRRCWRHRRPGWSRWAGCRAPASRAWPAPWPRRWAPRPARWCCAATRSGSAGPGWRRRNGCPPLPTRRRRAPRSSPSSPRLAAEALRGGHAVIADAAFLRPAERAAIEAARGDAPFQGFWLEAPLDVLRARVAARRGDASDADAAVLEAAVARDPGPIAWQRLDAAADPIPAARSALGLNQDDP